MKYTLLFLTIGLFFSCDWAKRKTKETVNKGGEIVARTGSEFVDGMSKGIDGTFMNAVELSKELIKEGLETGKIIVSSTDSSTDNILSVYFIFNKDLSRNITVKVFDEKKQEYGRVTKLISGKQHDAKYIDFTFDKRTNIDGKGKLTFQ